MRSSFAVPHSEGEDQIALDMPFHQAMVDLLSRNGAKESIVGWYALHHLYSVAVGIDERYGR